jgi:N6-L-threonylcarbamoyladenine synthase
MGPGLAGCLLVGVNFAKGLALGLGLPLFGVNHMEGHIYAAWLEEGPSPAETPGFPLVCMLASGGHTELVLMRGHGVYEHLGRTRDDAAGEAFDKAARVLGLGFPGGPAIQGLAAQALHPSRLPRAWLGDSLEFSFSGLKTAVLRSAQASFAAESAAPEPSGGESPAGAWRANLAAGFQEAVVDVLVGKTLRAVERHGARGVLLGGGVAANTMLREWMRERSPVPVVAPRPALCTDNGAMVAAAAHFAAERGVPPSLDFEATPSLRVSTTLVE